MRQRISQICNADTAGQQPIDCGLGAVFSGVRKQSRRHGDAKRIGGFAVDASRCLVGTRTGLPKI